MITRHTPSACPHCGHKVDAAEGIGQKAAPEPGDIGLCVGCGGWMQFGEGLVMIVPTISEADILLGMPDKTRRLAVEARELILLFRKLSGGG